MEKIISRHLYIIGLTQFGIYVETNYITSTRYAMAKVPTVLVIPYIYEGYPETRIF